MADRETNLHPKNNTTVDLKPNIVSNNIPDKAVTLEKLDQSLQDTIASHTSSIATNTEDIAKNKADIAMNTKVIAKNKADIAKNTSNVNSILDIIDIANDKIKADVLLNSINGDDNVIVDVDVDESNEKLGIHLSPELQDTISNHTSTIATNTEDIAKNKADIAKNTEDITENKADITDNTLIISSLETKTKNLETRTKNLEDTKVIVNTGVFDPTSDNPSSQKSAYNMPIQFENIVDSHGNKRFAEGDINLLPEFSNLGITKLYGKWSLSGTHLMVVIAINIPANITIPVNSVICRFTFPNYIKDKIIGLWGNTIDVKSFVARNATAWYQNILILNNVAMFISSPGNIFNIGTSEAITTKAQSVCRIQFDLLIDSD